MKRRLDIAALTELGEHFFKHHSALFKLMRTGVIEIIELFQTVKLFIKNLRVSRQIKLGCM